MRKNNNKYYVLIKGRFIPLCHHGEAGDAGHLIPDLNWKIYAAVRFKQNFIIYTVILSTCGY